MNESELSPDIKVRNSTPVVQYVNNVFGDILQDNQVYKRWHMLPLVIHIRQKNESSLHIKSSNKTS